MLTAAVYRAAVVGRWIARITGTLVALFYLSFVFGEGPPPLYRLSLRENLLFLGFTALFAGLLLAWRWQLWGGLVPLAGFALLAATDAHFLIDVSSLTGGVGLFLVPAAVGALNLLCWWRLRAGPPAGGVEWRVPRPALAAAGMCVAVFVALCANEMFVNPPLMTPSFRPPDAMVSEWRSLPARAPSHAGEIEVVFAIHRDGSVTGRVGDAEVTGGRMAYNRSWFGRLMNWREEYAISGSLSQAVRLNDRTVFAGQFAAPLTMKAGDLSGEVAFKNRGFSVRLGKE